MVRLYLALIFSLLSFTCCASVHHPIATVAMTIEGQEYGFIPPLTTELHDQLALLETQLAKLHISVERVNHDVLKHVLGLPPEWVGNVWGVADIETRQIKVLDTLSADAVFLVLVHESAHLFQPPNLTRAQNEVFAELVVFEVMAYYDHDNSYAGGMYLAGYKSSLSIIPYVKIDVRRARDIILGKREL